MKFIGAIDQGTTSTRFIIFDHAGKIVSSAQREHQQIFPQPGWVEHDPMEILENVKLTAAEAIIKAGIRADGLEAIGITNQRETTIVWNRITGRPYHNAIVWQDMRSQDIVAKCIADMGMHGFAGITGLPFSQYFSAFKLVWMLQHVEGLMDAAISGQAIFGTIDTWLLWNFTGEHKTDSSNASRTMLMDLQRLAWDKNILDYFNIPVEMLPSIHPGSGWMGTIREGALKGIPVLSCLGDQHAALVGQQCFEAGQAKNTYGTGCFMLMNTGTNIIKSSHGLLSTLGYQLGDSPCIYALEGSIAVTGSLVQWLRDNLGIIQSSDEIEALAASVPDNGDVYLVPAFSGLYAPYWRNDARGVLVGLTRYATKAHIARAVLEAAAYQTQDVLLAMQADSGIQLSSLKADGGMVVNSLLMQFQADISQVAVQTNRINETTSLGAAYAAGLASGYWKDTSELLQHQHTGAEWNPGMESEKREALYKRWQQAVERSLNWVVS